MPRMRPRHSPFTTRRPLDVPLSALPAALIGRFAGPLRDARVHGRGAFVRQEATACVDVSSACADSRRREPDERLPRAPLAPLARRCARFAVCTRHELCFPSSDGGPPTNRTTTCSLHAAVIPSRDLAARFEAYADWRRRLSAGISSLHEWLSQQDLADAQADVKVQQLIERLQQDKLVVAFVAEFSRGKSELINAIFFADFGQRLLPSSAGRTTMCPTELLHDPSRPPSIRLLPIETRLPSTRPSSAMKEPFRWGIQKPNIGPPRKASSGRSARPRGASWSASRAVARRMIMDGDLNKKPPRPGNRARGGRGRSDYFFFSSWVTIPFVSPVAERLLAVVLGVVGYRVLMWETTRYRDVLDYLARYGR